MIQKVKKISICTWNVNSFTKRYILIKDILLKKKLNFFLIQETRSDFSDEILLDLKHLGYSVHHCKPIKGRNGVAIIYMKHFKSYLNRSLTFLKWEYQGRFQYLSIPMNNRTLHLINIYVPTGHDYVNGRTINDIRSKDFKGIIYRNKIRLMRELNVLINTIQKSDYIVLGGDFNIVTLQRDSWHKYRDQDCPYFINFSKLEKDAMHHLLVSLFDYGYYDKNEHNYTWYDYKYPLNLNKGMKLDYLLVNSNLSIDKYQRLTEYRNLKLTSDHVPLYYSFFLD